MIYPTRGDSWHMNELRSIVEKLSSREISEPLLGHAADAIAFLLDQHEFIDSYDAQKIMLKDLEEEISYTVDEAQRLIDGIGGLKKCLNTLTPL